MRALLVTSRTTFVPGNYDELIVGLAASPEIYGLLILDNRSWTHIKTGLSLIALGARGIGTQLLRNHFGASHQRRLSAYSQAGKKVWQLPSINAPEAVALIAREGIDLLVNARTREIYRQDVLATPRLGCINIHHGLLPEQRGTMCDLWALAEGQEAGFSVHYMTAKIDAGEILQVQPVSQGEQNYQVYLQRVMAEELKLMHDLLPQFATTPPRGQPNQRKTQVPHRRNPTPAAIRAMLKRGFIL